MVEQKASLRTAVDQLSGLRDEIVGFVQRFSWSRFAGLTFGGQRDLYTILGYQKILKYQDYRSRYERGGIATRIIEVFPKATWRGGGEVIEDDNEKTLTTFEKAWSDLDKRLSLWQTMQTADIMARIGSYSVLLIGDGGDVRTELKRSPGPDALLYVTPYSEFDAQVIEWETDSSSPRFGQPKEYSLRRTRPAGSVVAANDINIRQVHWSRVIHVCEGSLDDKVFGKPALESPWNLLDDLDKVTGGGAEAFWLRANQGVHLDVDKDIPVDDNTLTDLKKQADDYQHGIRRMLRTRGTKVTALGSDVANIQPTVDSLTAQISGTIGVPQRILLGSERGELASSQDAVNFNSQIHDRRHAWAGPYVVRPLVDRLIKYNFLPTPKQYEVSWPELKNMTDTERVDLAVKAAQVNQTFGSMVITEDEIREYFDKPPLTTTAEPLTTIVQGA